MLSSPLTRLAGPMSLVAGVLIVVAQLMMLPFDPNEHVATSTDPGYQIAGGVYMVGFCALMVALFGAYGWGVHRAGRFGVDRVRHGSSARCSSVATSGSRRSRCRGRRCGARLARHGSDDGARDRRGRQLPVLRDRLGPVGIAASGLAYSRRRSRRDRHRRLPRVQGLRRPPGSRSARGSVARRLDDQVDAPSAKAPTGRGRLPASPDSVRRPKRRRVNRSHTADHGGRPPGRPPFCWPRWSVATTPAGRRSSFGRQRRGSLGSASGGSAPSVLSPSSAGSASAFQERLRRAPSDARSPHRVRRRREGPRW